jgi:hypothetical protein
VILVRGVTLPASISDAEVSTFSTEPGSYTSRTAREPRSDSGVDEGLFASNVG